MSVCSTKYLVRNHKFYLGGIKSFQDLLQFFEVNLGMFSCKEEPLHINFRAEPHEHCLQSVKGSKSNWSPHLPKSPSPKSPPISKSPPLRASTVCSLWQCWQHSPTSFWSPLLTRDQHLRLHLPVQEVDSVEKGAPHVHHRHHLTKQSRLSM